MRNRSAYPLATTARPVRSDAEIRRDREMRSWAATMGTTAERLQKAVDAVGISPRKVRSYLREQAGLR
jgi:hypothetical protein